jgi:hypothetical protein
VKPDWRLSSAVPSNPEQQQYVRLNADMVSKDGVVHVKKHIWSSK